MNRRVASGDGGEARRVLGVAPISLFDRNASDGATNYFGLLMAHLLRTSTEEVTHNVGRRADIVPPLFFDRKLSGVLETGSMR